MRKACVLQNRSALAILSALSVTASADQAFFTGVGFLPGEPQSSAAYGVSGDGSVVVGNASSSGGYQAFRWTAVDGMVGLGNSSERSPAPAWRVSADGSVIVGLGFYWALSTGVVGYPGSPAACFYANALSADGSVFAGAQRFVRESTAARWSPGGEPAPLTNSSAPYARSAAGDISADGHVIVGSGDAAWGRSEAFRWTQEDGLVGLGYLADGGCSSAALAVSADGAVIVGEARLVSPGYVLGKSQAFRWTQAAGMVGLGALRPGDESIASDTSGNGSIVVGTSGDVALPGDGGFVSTSTAIRQEAFMWDATHGMRSLKDALTHAGLDLTGWTLRQAHGISDDGLTIVGVGIGQDGASQGWVAHIPEPATLLLLGVGAAVARRRRQGGAQRS